MFSTLNVGLCILRHFEATGFLGELLGSLCGKLGSQVYLETKNKIYDGIRSNLNRNSRSNSPETAQSNREENFENVSPSFDQVCIFS